MPDFLERYSILIVTALFVVRYIWAAFSSRKGKARAEAWLTQSRADSQRHDAAVEEKLDRIIALLEKNGV